MLHNVLNGAKQYIHHGHEEVIASVEHGNATSVVLVPGALHRIEEDRLNVAEIVCQRRPVCSSATYAETNRTACLLKQAGNSVVDIVNAFVS